MSPSDPPPSPSRQPSLIDLPDDESALARNAPSLRMLDGLDETGGIAGQKKPTMGAAGAFTSAQAASGAAASQAAGAPAARSGRTGWSVATALALLVLAGIWWSTEQHDVAPLTSDVEARAKVAPMATASTRSTTLVPAATITDRFSTIPSAASSSAPASGASAIAAAEPARIETVRDADVTAPLPLALEPSQWAVLSGSPAAAQDPNARATSLRPRFGGAHKPAHAATVAAAPARKAESTRPRSGDPDVAIVDALLSRMADGAHSDPHALPRPALGDLIERCESRAGKGSTEAAGCRAHICADRWGKTDACPAALAPKRD